MKTPKEQIDELFASTVDLVLDRGTPAERADGLACVFCGTKNAGSMVPIGHNPHTGAQVFCCTVQCTEPEQGT